jgi:hypothetical protein
MGTVIRELQKRNVQLMTVSRYFLHRNIAWNENLTCSISEHFAQIIGEGLKIIKLLNEVKTISTSCDIFKQRIKSYLEESQRAISILGSEVLEEFCELIKILRYFEYQRLLLIEVLDGISDDATY